MSPAEELRFQILAAQREGERAFAALLTPLGLTPAQAEALRRIGQAEPVTLLGLGKRLVCETGSPSRLVSTLVDRGLVARADNPANRREVLLRLTEEGQRLAAGAAEVESALHAWIGALLSPAEIESALTVLRKATSHSAGGAAIALRLAENQAPEGET